MKGAELIVVAVITLILLISIAITVPVELYNRDHTHSQHSSIPTGRSLRYFIVGDYGQLDRDAEDQPVQEVAARMSNQSLLYPIDFIATTGDNIYPDGMKDLFDWKQFELMYSVFDQPGLSGKPWFPVFGNHDCDNRKPMLEANDIYPMWNMPSAYYNFSVSLDNSTRAVFVFLDGCTIACEDLHLGPVPPYCADYKYTTEEIDAQYTWLDEVLAEAADAAWILVHTHIPPFSAGSGSGDNESLKEKLYQKLDIYGVDFLFTGHEHLMEYIYVPPNSAYVPLPDENYTCSFLDAYMQLAPQNSVVLQKGSGLQEVVMGSSGHPLDKLCPSKTTSMDLLLFGSTTYGFAQVEVATDAVTVAFYSTSASNPLYTVQVVR